MGALQHIDSILRTELATVVGTSLARLVLAAILGGVIGLERELKHRPSGLRTNLFICLGAAMYTLLSDALAAEHIGDHTRIAAQIIPGIGFIGAGTIMHARGELVTGLTSAATLFVVASVGMAVGGGLYLTATFATGLILLTLLLLGQFEDRFSLKMHDYGYEVTGHSVEEISAEVNHLLENVHLMPQNVQTAVTKQHVRMQFELEGTRQQQDRFVQDLRRSSVFDSVAFLGPVAPE
jgi:putative Mg2+ transporter-C (MgtC) family protein